MNQNKSEKQKWTDFVFEIKIKPHSALLPMRPSAFSGSQDQGNAYKSSSFLNSQGISAGPAAVLENTLT